MTPWIVALLVEIFGKQSQAGTVFISFRGTGGDEHGIGLLNVKAVVDKYGGDMVLSCDENEFKAVVIL